MYIKSFYTLFVAFVAIAIQVVMLCTLQRSGFALCVIALLSGVTIIALLFCKELQHKHMRLNRMRKAYQYRTHRRARGYAV